MVKLHFVKSDKIYTITQGKELLQAYQQDPMMPLQFGCCMGTCGTCKIKILEGNENLSKLTKQEKETLKLKGLEADYRLACQCAIMGDVVID